MESIRSFLHWVWKVTPPGKAIAKINKEMLVESETTKAALLGG
jgi:hypothetical protein